MAYSQLLPFHLRMLCDLESSKQDSVTGNVDWDALETSVDGVQPATDDPHGSLLIDDDETVGNENTRAGRLTNSLREVTQKLLESSPLRERSKTGGRAGARGSREGSGQEQGSLGELLTSDGIESTDSPTTSTTIHGTNLDTPPLFLAPSPVQVQLDTNADFLLVVARGLAIRQILLTYIKLLSHPNHLVFLINENQAELEALKQDLVDSRKQDEMDGVDPNLWGDPDYFKIVTTETMTTVNERVEAYLQGGVLATTSRILVADLLNEVVPVHLCQGFLVARAERINPLSIESFILRLFRTHNKCGFIKAFSDRPEQLVQGMWKLEKCMRALFVRRCIVWPRFHLHTSLYLSARQPQLIEVRVPLSEPMRTAQAGLVECLEATLREVGTGAKLETDNLTLSAALQQGFERSLQAQLDPRWHFLSARTRGLVGDIGTLKRLLDSLLHTDPVTHLALLDSLLFASLPDPRNPANPLRNPERHPWLLTDAGQTVVEVGRKRCYRMHQVETVAEGAPGAHPGLPPRTTPTLDPPPKWRALLGVLSEVLVERDAMVARAVDSGGQPPGPIVVLTNGDRGAKVARELIEGAGIGVRRGDALGTMRTNGKRKRREDEEDSEAEDEDDGEDIVPGEVEGGEEAVETVGGGDSDGESESRSADQSSRRTLSGLRAPGSEVSSGRDPVQPLLLRYLVNYFKWKGRLGSRGRSTGGASTAQSNRGGVSSRGRGAPGAPPPGKRRRIKGQSLLKEKEDAGSAGSDGVVAGRAGFLARAKGRMLTFEEEVAEVAKFIEQNDQETRTTLDPSRSDIDPATATDSVDEDQQPVIIVRPYSNSSSAPLPADDDSRFLERVKPDWIIMLDPDPGFVRRVECYQATRDAAEEGSLFGRSAHHIQSRGDPVSPTGGKRVRIKKENAEDDEEDDSGRRRVKVHFMVYEDSLEEQAYLSTIRREKDCFERIIKEKSNMAIPIDSDGRVVPDADDGLFANSRIAGGRSVLGRIVPTIVIDSRELRSSLPSMLHAKGYKLAVRTLEVGDYVLTPNICVERKSISDLIGSFKNGRLYSQVEAMNAHYKFPTLLIEFDANKAFSFQSASDVKSEISFQDVQSKLTLLTLSFPNLRYVWSPNPHTTADIFEELKQNQEEPNPDHAGAVGVDNLTDLTVSFAPVQQDMLRALPGITSRSAKLIMQKYRNFLAVSNLSEDELIRLIGTEDARRVVNFFKRDGLKWDGESE